MATVTQIHELIYSKLPASGGVPLRDFTASLPEIDRNAAMGQVQSLKLSGKLATWLVIDDSGKAVSYIGKPEFKPVKL